MAPHRLGKGHGLKKEGEDIFLTLSHNDKVRKRIAILGLTAVVQKGNIRKTMAAHGLVKRGPRSGSDIRKLR